MADLQSLLQPLLEHASVRNAMAALAQPGARPVALSGLTPAAKALYLVLLWQATERPLLVLADGNQRAERSVTASGFSFVSYLLAI